MRSERADEGVRAVRITGTGDAGMRVDTALTCQLHGWKFDLPTGRCLASVGHTIRADKTA